MKKSIVNLVAFLMSGLCCFSAVGCGGNPQNSAEQQEKVSLVAIENATAVGTVDADYYLLAEPAVSAQRSKGYSIAGDIQALYGGEQGYPQAVLVAKTELVREYEGWINTFTQKLSSAAAWLQTADGAQIVSAVNAHMDDKDTLSSLKAPLLTADVMGRCGVRFAYASESKTEVEGFLTQMRAVNDKAAAIPAQAFYWETSEETSAIVPERELTVYMPDGAPALSMAKLMAEDTETDGFAYKVVAPSLIASKVTNKEMANNADFCVLPVTAASKLLGTGEKYQMLGVVTHGNLFLISKDGKQFTAENLSTLKGKKVGVLQIKEVPGLTFKTVLNKYGIPFEEKTSLNG